MTVHRDPTNDRFYIEGSNVYFYWDLKAAEYKDFRGHGLGPNWDTAVRATAQLASGGKPQKARK